DRPRAARGDRDHAAAPVSHAAVRICRMAGGLAATCAVVVACSSAPSRPSAQTSRPPTGSAGGGPATTRRAARQDSGLPGMPPPLDSDDVYVHAGSRLVADLADRTTLTGRPSAALAGLGRPRTAHDPRRV